MRECLWVKVAVITLVLAIGFTLVSGQAGQVYAAPPYPGDHNYTGGHSSGGYTGGTGHSYTGDPSHSYTGGHYNGGYTRGRRSYTGGAYYGGGYSGYYPYSCPYYYPYYYGAYCSPYYGAYYPPPSGYPYPNTTYPNNPSDPSQTSTVTTYSTVTQTSVATATSTSTVNPMIVPRASTGNGYITRGTTYAALAIGLLALLLAAVILLMKSRTRPQQGYVGPVYQCNSCGTNLEPSSQFCGKCGAQLNPQVSP